MAIAARGRRRFKQGRMVMRLGSNRICPVERAGHLDNRIRRWLQRPRNILAPYVKAGMTVLDIGCGPGFFTIDMARIVGDSGRVIAADLQAAMLQKAQNVGLESAEGPRVLLSKTALLRKRPSPATA